MNFKINKFVATILVVLILLVRSNCRANEVILNTTNKQNHNRNNFGDLKKLANEKETTLSEILTKEPVVAFNEWNFIIGLYT